MYIARIGHYQIQNLVSNSNRFYFFYLLSGQGPKGADSIETSSQGHSNSRFDDWLKSQTVALDEAGVFQALVDSPKDFPIVLVSEHEADSTGVSERLMQAGHLNVFVVAGGLPQLLQDWSEVNS